MSQEASEDTTPLVLENESQEALDDTTPLDLESKSQEALDDTTPLDLENKSQEASDDTTPVDLENVPQETSEDDLVNFNFDCPMEECFQAFDKDEDEKLSLDDFRDISHPLFRMDGVKTYRLEECLLQQMFEVFDVDGDGFLDKSEFEYCWNNWIQVIYHPTAALLIVDVQNDFISGSLSIKNCPAQQDGCEVVDPINNLLNTVKFHSVFYSMDWHPPDHISFIENIHTRELDPSSPISADEAKILDEVIFAGDPPMPQKLWPAHCVQDTWGAELHQCLKMTEYGIIIYKGTNPDVDSYSAFFDNKKLSQTILRAQIKRHSITDLYICGLAYDVCVRATALDALCLGLRTILIDDCCRGVDEKDIEETKEEILTEYGVIVESKHVQAMAEGKDRRPELGYKLAMKIKRKRAQ